MPSNTQTEKRGVYTSISIVMGGIGGPKHSAKFLLCVKEGGRLVAIHMNSNIQISSCLVDRRHVLLLRVLMNCEPDAVETFRLGIYSKHPKSGPKSNRSGVEQS